MENMENKIKNYLGIAISIAALIAAFAFVGFVGSYSKSIEPSSFRSFSVSGEGEATVIPDVAEFSFSVITEGGEDIAVLQQENTQNVNGAVDFLKSTGIEAKDIKTQSYNLSPRYQYFRCPPVIEINGKPCPPREIVGYTVSQSVSVKVRNFDVIGKALAGVVDNGANSVSGLSFVVDDPTSAENQARAQAITKAKEKAKAIAKAGGFRLGRLLSIQESSVSPRPFYLEAARGGAATEDIASLAPTIEPGSQEVTVNLTLTYEIR